MGQVPVGFDPHRILGLEPGASPRTLEEAAQRRRRETDPARVAGMDPRIQEAARAARAEVELAVRWLQDPDSVGEQDLRALAAFAPSAPQAPEEDGPAPKSYLRALVLTLMLPGAGSWYAGGRLRGLVALGIFCLVLVWMLHGAQGAMNAAGGGLSSRMQALSQYLEELRGAFYGLMLILLADAMAATWAHNDRLKS